MSARILAVMEHIAPSQTSGAAVTSSPTSGSLFSDVAQAPDDAILGLDIAFKRDTAARKLNLGVGAYRTDEGLPYLLNVVQKVTNHCARWSGLIYREPSMLTRWHRSRPSSLRRRPTTSISPSMALPNTTLLPID